MGEQKGRRANLTNERNEIQRDAQGWLWRLTTHHWFFVLYYSLLSFAFFLITFEKPLSMNSVLIVLVLTLLFMPAGFLYLIMLLTIGPLGWQDLWRGGRWFQFLPLILLAAFIFLGLQIQRYKNKNPTIATWLIIALFLLITLSFVGCTLGALNNAFYSLI